MKFEACSALRTAVVLLALPWTIGSAVTFEGATPDQRGDPVDVFWSRLLGLCGQAFEGQLTEHPQGEDSMVGQRLVVHVRDCQAHWIRMPFQVGEDRSRTWVLTRVADRLELRHAHRHEDGTPSELTMYGGVTTNQGRPGEQYFPADERTRQIIEEALNNVWMIGIEPNQTLTYALWRVGTERAYRIEFDLRRPIDPPPPPWGWEG